MVKKLLNLLLHKIVTFFAGQQAKGQPADYPTLGQVRVQSTFMPDDKVSFNDWVDNLEKVKTGKWL